VAPILVARLAAIAVAMITMVVTESMPAAHVTRRAPVRTRCFGRMQQLIDPAERRRGRPQTDRQGKTRGDGEPPMLPQRAEGEQQLSQHRLGSGFGKKDSEHVRLSHRGALRLQLRLQSLDIVSIVLSAQATRHIRDPTCSH
jgi:hypothetical protein